MSTSLSGIAEVMNEGLGKITSDEKIIIARETNRARLPRELAKWLRRNLITLPSAFRN